MGIKNACTYLFLLIASLAALPLATAQTPQGTAFTYQGELKQNGAPVTASTDMVFDLFVAASGGAQVGSSLLFTAANGNPVQVQNGIFTVALDFGALAFNTLVSDERYLRVTINGNALSPRTKIENAPYALQSRTAELAYTVSDASIGSAQIVPSQVQQRVGGTCNVGSSIQSIAQNGTVTCQSGGSGTVTSVGAGTGLSGGPITSSGTLAVDTTAIQTRITGSCSAGQKVLAVNADGTVVCGIDATNAGTVTSVGSGTGLTGGPISTTGTLSIANGGVGLAQINTAQVQARISGTCPLGQYINGINPDGSVVCVPVPGPQLITTVDNSPNVGSFTAIAIGTDGLPVVSYYGNSSLKVAHCANTACTGIATINAVDTAGDVGQYTSIAIGADTFPVVSYYDATNGDLKVAHCASADCTGTATITAVDTGGIVGLYTSIAIGADTFPVVSYFDGTNSVLKVAHCANAACTGAATITALDAPSNTAIYTAIAIGRDGLPVVGYYGNYNLKVAHCANAACTGIATITVVDNSGGTNGEGQFTSIAIGHDGLPVLSYYDVANGHLRVAHCANAACTGVATITVVDSTGTSGVGQYTSIAIGTDGVPVMSYYDVTHGHLKMARCANTACTVIDAITSIDTAVNGGKYTAIATGTDGLPVVSYYDVTNGHLKVAHCGTGICQ